MDESRVYKLWVLGRPAPKERARKGKAGFYTPKRTKDWENLIRWKWIEQYGHEIAFEKGWVQLTVVAYYRDRRVADWDNIGKIVSDALNGLAYTDDRQVADGHVIRFVDAEVEGVEIEVRPWNGGEGIAPAE